MVQLSNCNLERHEYMCHMYVECYNVAINNAFVEHILEICGVSLIGNGEQNYKPSLASTFWKSDTRTYEGENRHLRMLSIMDSLLMRNSDVDKELIFKWAMDANNAQCNPPLPVDELRKMFDDQCVEYARKKLEEKIRIEPIRGRRRQLRRQPWNESHGESEEEPEEVLLDIAESLQQEKILTRFVVDMTTSCIKVSLNDVYGNKTIVSDISKKWYETRNIFTDIAKKKGVSDKHVDMLVDVLDNNNKKIMQCLVGDSKGSSGGDKDIIALEQVEEQLATDGLFLDEVKSPYATIEVNGHIETMKIRSQVFEDWIGELYYTQSKQDGYPSILSKVAIDRIQSILSHEAKNKERTLHLRVAAFVDTETRSDKNAIFYEPTLFITSPPHSGVI